MSLAVVVLPMVSWPVSLTNKTDEPLSWILKSPMPSKLKTKLLVAKVMVVVASKVIVSLNLVKSKLSSAIVPPTSEPFQ